MYKCDASHSPCDNGAALLQAYQDALQKGDAAAVEAAALRFFVYACEQTGKQPDEKLLLTEAAHQHENLGQWKQAEDAYRQALALAKAQQDPMQIYKVESDLSSLFRFLGQKEQALESAQRALEAARRSRMKPLIGMALEGVTICWLCAENFDKALQATKEMVQLIPADKMYDTQRARALVLQAECLTKLHRTTEAERDLEIAWPLLMSMSGASLFVGVQSGLAKWWEVMAQLESLQADFQAAVTAWGEAVKYRRTVSQALQLGGPYKHASLARTLRRFGQALLAIEDVAGSEQAFQESRTIRKSIKQP